MQGDLAGRTKIAIDAHVIEGRPQGSRTTLINLLREVAALGRAGDFALYCSDPVLCRERLGVDGFDYITIAPGGSIKRLVWTLPHALAKQGANKALWQYISTPFFRGQNIVVIHDVLPFTHPKLFPLGFRLRCQVLFTLSMFDAEKIVVVSEFSRQAVAGLFPSLARKLVVIPNGPSFPMDTYFQGKPALSSRPRPFVMTVGRIEERKNVPLLARAFVAAGLTDVDLVIVGKRDLEFGDPLPAHPAIHVLDNLDDRQLVDLYRGAALFVFPSQAEGFGIPLLDAILFGVPTISSDRTAMPEVAAGLADFFDPTANDAEAILAQKIRGHFDGNLLPAATLSQRIERAEAFNWRQSAGALVDLLSKAA